MLVGSIEPDLLILLISRNRSFNAYALGSAYNEQNQVSFRKRRLNLRSVDA